MVERQAILSHELHGQAGCAFWVCGHQLPTRPCGVYSIGNRGSPGHQYSAHTHQQLVLAEAIIFQFFQMLFIGYFSLLAERVFPLYEAGAPI